MLWYLKVLEIVGNIYRIAYSFETNNSCDGLLEFNGDSGESTIVKMSKGCDDYFTRKLISKISYLYDTKGISQDLQVIAIG